MAIVTNSDSAVRIDFEEQKPICKNCAHVVVGADGFEHMMNEKSGPWCNTITRNMRVNFISAEEEYERDPSEPHLGKPKTVHPLCYDLNMHGQCKKFVSNGSRPAP